MASAIGLLTGFTTAEESVYGTVVTPDRPFEVLNETLERKHNVVESNGLRAGTINFRRGSRRGISRQWAEGTVTMEVPHVGFGRWLKHAVGGTPTVVQQGATTAWLQTHSFGSTSGKSLTLQKQLRDPSNTLVQQFTYPGSKIRSFKLSISADGLLMAEFGILARQEQKTTAAAALSYPATIKNWTFNQGLIKVGGTQVGKVSAFEETFTRPIREDAFFLGNGGLMDEPYENDRPTCTGTIDTEFDSATVFYDRFAADSAAELILEFTGAVISGAFSELLRLTIPEIHFTGETPKVGGPEVVAPKVPFEAAYDGTNPGFKVEYMSTDTAA